MSVTELQIINFLLSSKSMNICIFNNIDENYFVQYREDFKFIWNHYQKFKNIPDRITFTQTFPETENIIVSESEEYLIKNIKDDFLFRKVIPFFNKVRELLAEDANEAYNYFYSNAKKYFLLSDIYGVDFNKDANLRFNVFKEKTLNEKMNVISTPFKELDDYIYGWRRGEELVAIIGRPKTFKSWLLYLIAIAAKNSGERVGIFSGESSVTIVSYRLDTLGAHFSNTALMNGFSNEYNKYEEYIKSLKEKENELIIVTEEEIGENVTVSKLASLVEKYNLGMLCIDPLPALEDERATKYDNVKKKYKHILKDLYNGISKKFKIPVIFLTWANREVKEGECPNTYHVSEADEIGQYCTKIIGIAKDENDIFKICVREDRYGKIEKTKNEDDKWEDKILFYKCDIDKGYFEYIPSTSDKELEEKYKKRYEKKENSDVF